jgi:hypothetical protein
LRPVPFGAILLITRSPKLFQTIGRCHVPHCLDCALYSNDLLRQDTSLSRESPPPRLGKGRALADILPIFGKRYHPVSTLHRTHHACTCLEKDQFLMRQSLEPCPNTSVASDGISVNSCCCCGSLFEISNTSLKSTHNHSNNEWPASLQHDVHRGQRVSTISCLEPTS